MLIKHWQLRKNLTYEIRILKNIYIIANRCYGNIALCGDIQCKIARR